MQLQDPTSERPPLNPLPWPFIKVPLLSCYLLGAAVAVPFLVLIWLLAGSGMIIHQISRYRFYSLIGVDLFSFGILFSCFVLLGISLAALFGCYRLFWTKDQKIYLAVYVLGWLSMLGYALIHVYQSLSALAAL